MVPPSLAATTAAAAGDEAVALLLPQLRGAAQHMLQCLNPAVLSAVQQAHAVPVAWAAGQRALEQLQDLEQQLQQLIMHFEIHNQNQQQEEEVQQRAVGVWLETVQQAFQGLGYAPRQNAQLLQGTLHGLSLIAAAGSAAAGAAAEDNSSRSSWASSTRQRVGQLLVGLLRHHSASVRQLVWQLLQSSVAAAAEHHSSSSRRDGVTAASQTSSSHSSAVVQLLLLPEVVECLVVEQLCSNSTNTSSSSGAEANKPGASALLMALLRCGGDRVAQQLLPWRPWISSSTGDTAGDALNQALAAFLDQQQQHPQQQHQPQEAGQGFWAGRLPAVLQDLFSASAGTRCGAGRALLQLLTTMTTATGGQEELMLGPEELEGFAGKSSSSSMCLVATAAAATERP